MTSYLRPDEKSAQSDIEKSKQFDQKIKSGFSTASNVGLTIAGAGVAAKAISPLASKIMPFINKYIPTDVALQGISKVSPEIGALLNKGMKQGLSINDGLDFLKNQFQEKKQEPAKENRNIIEQESPELHQFIVDEIKKGRTPIQAGALAFNDKKFMQAINKLKNSHKLNWGSIVENIYGKGETALPQQTEQQPQQNTLAEDVMNPPGSLPSRPPSAEAQAAANSQQNNIQSGGLDPQVAQILQQGQALLQSFKR